MFFRLLVILTELIHNKLIIKISFSFASFLYRYASVQFSKNPEKYVKYQPYEVKAMLNKLFDDSV